MLDSIIIAFETQLTPAVWELIGRSTYETIYMSLVATFFAVLFGLPLGVLTFITEKGEILEHTLLNRILNIVINVGRSIPFIILLLLLMDTTRALVGTTIGTTASIIPLSVSALPFFARLTANALSETPKGLTEAAKAMGATNWQVITKFYLPEAKTSLIKAITLTLVGVIGYSAMAGTQGGGGLGNTAISYGVHRNMEAVKWVATIIIVALVMLSEKYGNKIADRHDHR